MERYRGLPEEGPFRTTPASAIRLGEWKLIRFYESATEELYNLTADPSEVQELSAEEPERLADLSEKLTVWLKKTEAFIPTEINPKYDGVKSE